MSVQSFQRTKTGALVVSVVVLLTAWLLAQALLRGTDDLLIALGGAAAVLFVIRTSSHWRMGVLLFLTWMLFEDLARKFLGNSMAVYFVKDGLALVCYLSFCASRVPKRILQARPAFFLPFCGFFLWSVIEISNPASPSVWYGVMGLKDYFGYAPLFFLGYALLQNESDLRRFLTVNMVLAALIALLGIVQAATGEIVLAPAELAPDIKTLGTIVRTAPITGEKFIRPPSVFVSDGRFGAYLLLAFLIALGATSYFFMRRLRERKWIAVAMVVIIVGILLSAIRGTLVWAIISVLVFYLANAIGTRVRSPALRRASGPGARVAILSILAFTFLASFYSEALNSRIAFYQQTLLPSSSAFELRDRVWEYPIAQLQLAFAYPNWRLGYGTGTASLGGQYVTRIFGVPRTNVSVESGYGNLMLELGIPGLLLWFAWTTTLLVSEWKVVRQLRGTALFPLGFVIFWFSFINLVPAMLSGIAIENFITNAYLFLLAGVLFSLPALMQPRAPTDTSARETPSAVILERSARQAPVLSGR